MVQWANWQSRPRETLRGDARGRKRRLTSAKLRRNCGKTIAWPWLLPLVVAGSNPAWITMTRSASEPDHLPGTMKLHLKAYLEKQIEEIMRYKWIRSEQLGHDIGAERAAREWIDMFAENFARHWRDTNIVSTRKDRRLHDIASRERK